MFEARPFTADHPTKISYILRKMIAFETLFNDYQPACKDVCGDCAVCQQRMADISFNLAAPNAITYEVWNDADLVGIIYATRVVPGHDALAHFAFWDEDLQGKTGIINRVLERAFGAPLNLHRVTVEVPDYMHSLINFIEKRLGFEREGVKREAMLWRGKWRNMHVLGKLNPNGRSVERSE